MVMALAAILKLPALSADIPDNVAAFNVLLRDVDLNENMQNGYAITAAEYEQLRSAWKGLLQADQFQLLNGLTSRFWTATFVPAILNDLNDDKDWEAHFNNLTNQGAAGLSLTLSEENSPMAVITARRMLVDLLYKGSSMFSNGSLSIDEEIKIQAHERAGARARQRLEKWERLINDYQDRSTANKLEAVNRFFNQQIRASADKMSKKGGDYWQSPIETLVRGLGDCDDFTMAKYVSLRLLGVPAEQLRVAVIKYDSFGNHAVLLFFPPNEKDPWVLDNLAFMHLGFTNHHILRLSQRMAFQKMTPLVGITEKFWTVFAEELNEIRQRTQPLQKWRKFSTALIHSQRVLPQTPGETTSQLNKID